MEQELIEYLSGFVTPRRLERMQAIIRERTRYLTVVLEDIYQPHNASAVLRSCDSCGVQDVHILEKRNSYRVNPGVELGTAQWLTLRRYRLNREPPGANAEIPSASRAGSPGSGVAEGAGATDPRPPTTGAALITPDPVRACLTDLRARGYRIVATTPHTAEVGLEEFDLFRGKVALCFGTEMQGLSEELLEEADEYVRIPMYGFVESFNISVSAAIILYTLTQRLRTQKEIPWRLTEDERQKLLLAWLRSSVKQADRLEARFRGEQQGKQ
ncbi:MAG: TrmH family RNA methyltransferase [Spirochaetaceae bacterium]